MLQCRLEIFWRLILVFDYISIILARSYTTDFTVRTKNEMGIANTNPSGILTSENFISTLGDKLHEQKSQLEIKRTTDDAENERYSKHFLKAQTVSSKMLHGTTLDSKEGFYQISACDINSPSDKISDLSTPSGLNISTEMDLVTNCTKPIRVNVKKILSSKKTLYIGGLFELSGPRSKNLGESELTAAKLAVKHVNEENILPGYELKLLYNDTKCDPGVGMDALYDFIYRQQQITMVIGSACSEVTKTLAEIVPYWNLILVSFASTSPALSEREKYKTFFRLAPADSSQNIPRAMFISDFGWDTVAILYEIDGDFSLAVDEMGSTFEQNNITIQISTSFRRYDDIAANLLSIKKHDSRIIIGGYSEKAARNVLCQAFNLGMYGPRYVWILIGDYVERWWEVTNDTTCSTLQLRLAAEGYFTIDSLNSLSEDDKSSMNISVRQFLKDYDLNNGPRPMSPYATSSYDTVWTIALTLKEAVERWDGVTNSTGDVLSEITYQDGENTSHLFLDIMQDLGFLGISGPISFEGPDRKGISVISQNQRGQMKRIALYDPDVEKMNFFCRTCQPIVWLGGRAPRDKIVIVARQKKIHYVAYLCVSSVSVGGLILAIFFLGYNLYHRRLRYIKLSSPKLNNVAAIGCMFVYAGIIVLGFDATNLYESQYPYLCTTRAFLFSAGFSLSFGSMFTKTYRVHQIFTRANGSLIKSKLLRDKQLLFIVGALLVVDSIVLLIWGVVDPMHKRVTNLTTEASENDEDLLYISQLTTCYSEHLDKWTGTLYAYKGLLLVFGVYMAWETRHVKIPALNDSRYIGMNVYNVVIMSVIVVSISNILSHQPTLAYVMESSFMLLSTTATLCLLFVPKIYSIMTYKGEPVIAASGITVDAGNCRRFAVDDRKEKFFRAEVQNRVYKREIVELDQEISRLESLLEQPIEPYPTLTTELFVLLPESLVDPSPIPSRHQTMEEKSGCSISDTGDVSMNITDDRSEDDQGEHTNTPQSFRRRSNRLSIRVATHYAYNKLCKLRPRFSVGSVSFRQDYEDLKTSPSSPDCFMSLGSPIERSKSSHPLLRQEAVEENKNLKYFIDLKQSSEKSESRTTDTHISDDIEASFDLTPASTQNNTIRDTVFTETNTETKGCENTENQIVQYVPPNKRQRKFGNTLDVPAAYEECRISEIDSSGAEHEVPRIRRARSIIEIERRTRIRKLQSDLKRIQKELQDLDELEYEVSIV